MNIDQFMTKYYQFDELVSLLKNQQQNKQQVEEIIEENNDIELSELSKWKYQENEMIEKTVTGLASQTEV